MVAASKSKKHNAYVEALLRVRKVLIASAKHRTVYLCLELDDVYTGSDTSNGWGARVSLAASIILADIKKALGSYRDVPIESWLMGKGFDAYAESRITRNAYRVRWVDALIEQYKDLPDPLCK